MVDKLQVEAVELAEEVSALCHRVEKHRGVLVDLAESLARILEPGQFGGLGSG